MNIDGSEASLPKLVEGSEAGEEIALARNGQPVSRLTSIQSQSVVERVGVAQGSFEDLEPDPALETLVAQLFGVLEA